MKKFLLVLIASSLLFGMTLSASAKSVTKIEYITQNNETYVTVSSINERWADFYKTGQSDTIYSVIPMDDTAIFISRGATRSLLLDNITLYEIDGETCVSYDCFRMDMLSAILSSENKPEKR